MDIDDEYDKAVQTLQSGSVGAVVFWLVGKKAGERIRTVDVQLGKGFSP